MLFRMLLSFFMLVFGFVVCWLFKVPSIGYYIIGIIGGFLSYDFIVDP